MIQRVFFPGSEWLYLKIYTSFKYADSLLIDNIVDFTDSLHEYNCIEKWFYIRHTDTNSHIRLRLKLKSTEDISTIFQLFSRKLGNKLSKGNIWDIKIDTYKRELERYGSERIEQIESIFHLDSICIINLLRNIYSMEDKDNIRWKLGLSLIDGLFDAFAYDINKRSCLMKYISNSFMKEFGFISAKDTRQLNDKYRNNRVSIEKIMNHKYEQLEAYYSTITKRTNEIEKIVFAMSKDSLDELLISLIHMTMNRLFMSNNRENETVLYYLLSKFYDSYNARQKNSNNYAK